MRHAYLTNRFFLCLGLVILLFVVGYWFPIVYVAAQAVLSVLGVLALLDALLLWGGQTRLKVRRRLPKLFSLSDPNTVKIEVTNQSRQRLYCNVIDELPIQLQERDFNVRLTLSPDEKKIVQYRVTPLNRGEYEFGNVNIFLTTMLGLLERRWVHDYPMMVPVYPSLVQMKQMELKAFERISIQQGGVKKMRRIGHSYEFEQIKPYVRGDDYRSINWKATGRANALMVNQYEDEKAQQVYCLIDKSRTMKMPFDGLSLMDYAVNSTLVIANIALQKQDRVGMITFSDIIGTTVKAERRPNQLNLLLQTLYREKARPNEANYELMYRAVRNLIRGRSMLLFFTNFESMYAAERVLPLLRKLNAQHLVVVVFFENTEIQSLVETPAESVFEVYTHTVARKQLSEKAQIAQKMRQYGIQVILTRPEDLSAETVNKYMEMKARGLI